MTILHHAGMNAEFVLPSVLKAMHQEHAERLLDTGEVCFTSVCCLTGLPADANTTSSPYATFLWCGATEKHPREVQEFWPEYDTVVEILDVAEFVKRLSEASDAIMNLSNVIFLPLRCGPVCYLQSQNGRGGGRFFQKAPCCVDQHEYRFAFECMGEDESTERILLNIGPCADIARLLKP